MNHSVQHTVSTSLGTSAPLAADSVCTVQPFAAGMIVSELPASIVTMADAHCDAGTTSVPPSTLPHDDPLMSTLGAGVHALASNAQLHALQPRPSSTLRGRARFFG